MSTEILWEPLSSEERKLVDHDTLWGDKSSQKDAIVSRPFNCVMPKYYQEISDKVRNFEVRDDDIWIVTYPKCGTTWTQEIVWHIMNDVNREAGELPLFSRSPFLEFQGIQSVENSPAKKFANDPKVEKMIRRIIDESVDYTDTLPKTRPRIIKTHLPLELLPDNLLDKAHVVYACRNPKDVCVSYYHHISDVFDELYEYTGTFDQFTECFMEGTLEYGRYFNHLKSAWKLRNHPNMKFFWYEDMKKNTKKEVSDLADFLKHPLSQDKIDDLVEHLSFKNMKQRATDGMGGEKSPLAKFYRKGEVGDWKNYFEGEKLEKWNTWIARNLEATDIDFHFE